LQQKLKRFQEEIVKKNEILKNMENKKATKVNLDDYKNIKD